MDRRFSLDHHLQSQIVQLLMMHGEQAFSQLKPAGIENSLFMYHMRKLISRGIAEKTASGFRLTPDGARWANKTGAALRIAELPRPMVQLIIIQENHILLSERIDHMASDLNRYMLPGTLHRFDEASSAAAERAAAKFGLTITSGCIGHTEIIIKERQHHALIDFYTATTPNIDYAFNDDLFQLRFVPLETVLAMTTDEANALPQIVKAFVAKTAYKDAYLL